MFAFGAALSLGGRCHAVRAAGDVKRPTSRVTSSEESQLSASPRRPVVMVVRPLPPPADVVQQKSASLVEKEAPSDETTVRSQSIGSAGQTAADVRPHDAVAALIDATSEPAMKKGQDAVDAPVTKKSSDRKARSTSPRVAASPKKSVSPRRPATLHGMVTQPDQIKRPPAPQKEAEAVGGLAPSQIPLPPAVESTSPADSPVAPESTNSYDQSQQAAELDDGVAPLPVTGDNAPQATGEVRRATKPLLEQPRSLGRKR